MLYVGTHIQITEPCTMEDHDDIILNEEHMCITSMVMVMVMFYPLCYGMVDFSHITYYRFGQNKNKKKIFVRKEAY